MGGMVLETNMNEIVAQVELQNRMEKSEVSQSATVKDHGTMCFCMFSTKRAHCAMFSLVVTAF